MLGVYSAEGDTVRREDVQRFVVESWAIEGLKLDAINLSAAISYHTDFLRLPTVYATKLEAAADAFCGGALRSRAGMNVSVGNYYPPCGRKEIRQDLVDICRNSKDRHPFLTHQLFEELHPFMDGNGRVGRLLWLWCMHNQGRHDWTRGFLHTWYYQSLEQWREDE